MSGDKVDALVIFGATGDLAKLETFPALVGLVERGVLDVPVVGVAKSGWSLDQFCDYAVASLKLNNMDPGTPAAKRMLDLLHYVDGDLGDPATYQAMSDTLGQSVQRVLFYLEVPPPLFARIAEGISTVGRAAGNRVMVEKPFGNGLASARKLNDTMHQFFPEDAIYRVDHWLGLDPVESLMFARFANSIIGRSSTGTTCSPSRSQWPRPSTSRTAAASTTRPARSPATTGGPVPASVSGHSCGCRVGDRDHPVATPGRPGSGLPSAWSGPDVELFGMVAPGK